MAKRGTLDDNTVWKVEEIKKIPNSDEARKLLLRVKEHADNVLKARGWKVKRLIEICCCERKNMGTNLGVGGWCRGDGPGAAHTIALRLRRPRSHEFVSFEHCLKVMWHEMAHIVHGNHSAAFYQEMDDIARHYELIKSKGQLVGLDGFPIGGGRNADPQRHNPSRAEGRAAGLKAAEARAKKQRVMGGGRLGGGAAHRKLSPREAAARAAERRAQDARNGLGDAELEVAAGRGEKRKSGPGLVWDGTFRAVCPVCGPVCTDKVEHAEVISDSDDDDLAGPVDYTQESQADEKAPAPAKPAARPRPAPTAQARRPAPSPRASRRPRRREHRSTRPRTGDRPSARRRRRPSTSPRRTRTAGAGLRRRGRARAAPLSTPAATSATRARRRGTRERKRRPTPRSRDGSRRARRRDRQRGMQLRCNSSAAAGPVAAAPEPATPLLADGLVGVPSAPSSTRRSVP